MKINWEPAEQAERQRITLLELSERFMKKATSLSEDPNNDAAMREALSYAATGATVLNLAVFMPRSSLWGLHSKTALSPSDVLPLDVKHAIPKEGG